VPWSGFWCLVSCFILKSFVSCVLCFPALPVPVSVCPVPDCSFPSPALSHSSASRVIASPALIVSTCVSFPCVFSLRLLLILCQIVSVLPLCSLSSCDFLQVKESCYHLTSRLFLCSWVSATALRNVTLDMIYTRKLLYWLHRYHLMTHEVDTNVYFACLICIIIT